MNGGGLAGTTAVHALCTGKKSKAGDHDGSSPAREHDPAAKKQQ